MGKAHVQSFQAVEGFRRKLVRYAESAAAALESAEGEGQRWLRWLEVEQRAHWKAARRAATEGLSRAKDAYRQKSLFKDSTGARNSAVDELVAVRRAEARLEECERGDRATRQHAAELKRELQQYRGGIARLRNLLDSDVPVAVADLASAVDALEKYAAAGSAVPVAADSQTPMSRPVEAADEDDELADDAALRRRTPTTRAREKAQATRDAAPLPDVPPAAREAALPRLLDRPPGKYDLVTISLPPGAAHVYMERVEPIGPTDSGWHVGAAGKHDPSPPCRAATFGRLTALAPHAGDLMRLPVGTLAVARAGTVARLLDATNRRYWEGEQ